jgi:gluconate 2-dehydrogenase gamma chain
VTETRRTALKMLGAVSATCAFPFAGDELYGQHHSPSSALPASAQHVTPYTPKFFTSAEYLALARLADVIIPPTDTPGGMGAGVHAYIDRVVAANAEHQPLARAGLAWLEHSARAAGAASFATLDETAAIALLQPASDAVDRENDDARRARFRAEDTGRLVYFVPTTDRDAAERGLAAPQSSAALAADDPALPARFFRLMKNLTADGYYTSRIGLLDELRYAGNTAMLEFPPCAP